VTHRWTCSVGLVSLFPAYGLTKRERCTYRKMMNTKQRTLVPKWKSRDSPVDMFGWFSCSFPSGQQAFSETIRGIHLKRATWFKQTIYCPRR
jgi:hypothetical protein